MSHKINLNGSCDRYGNGWTKGISRRIIYHINIVLLRGKHSEKYLGGSVCYVPDVMCYTSFLFNVASNLFHYYLSFTMGPWNVSIMGIIYHFGFFFFKSFLKFFGLLSMLVCSIGAFIKQTKFYNVTSSFWFYNLDSCKGYFGIVRIVKFVSMQWRFLTCVWIL